jgi:hypothetical protein
MKNFLLPLFLLGLLASCAQTSNGVNAGIYTDWKDRDPISRVNNNVSDGKTGQSCVTNILSVAVIGDSSIEAAKKDGGIKDVAFVDRTFTAVNFWFPIYQKGCTIVKGN